MMMNSESTSRNAPKKKGKEKRKEKKKKNVMSSLLHAINGKRVVQYPMEDSIKNQLKLDQSV